jgi:HNH endonuclease
MSKTYVFATLRRLVYDRACEACEYCLVPEIAVLVSHEVDHVIAEKHGGQTDESNLALACTICNKHKGSDLASIDPISGEIVRLYQPRGDRWSDHFQLDCKNGEIIPLTAIGRVTVRLLQLNRRERVEERELLIQAKVLHVDEEE